MDRIQFIHSPRENPATSALAITASCALHTLTLGSLLGLTFYYHSHPPPSQTGSAAGTPTIILEAVIIAPEEPRPLPAPALTPPTRPSKPTLAKTEMLHHMPTPNSAKPAAAAILSSYSPGVNILPHPPYPVDAQSRRQTGTVIMYVKFDAQGNVAHAEVSESSGVPSLDAATESFIREHWHSSDYAGQSVSETIEYALEKH